MRGDGLSAHDLERAVVIDAVEGLARVFDVGECERRHTIPGWYAPSDASTRTMNVWDEPSQIGNAANPVGVAILVTVRICMRKYAASGSIGLAHGAAPIQSSHVGQIDDER